MFDNTAVARDGTLEAGDEIVGVGGESVKGRSKVEVAKMIQVSTYTSYDQSNGNMRRTSARKCY